MRARLTSNIVQLISFFFIFHFTDNFRCVSGQLCNVKYQRKKKRYLLEQNTFLLHFFSLFIFLFLSVSRFHSRQGLQFVLDDFTTLNSSIYRVVLIHCLFRFGVSECGGPIARANTWRLLFLFYNFSNVTQPHLNNLLCACTERVAIEAAGGCWRWFRAIVWN